MILLFGLFTFFQWNIFQYPYQWRVIKAVKFLRETGRKVIEARKHAMARGEEVPDDILQRIIQQQGLQTESVVSLVRVRHVRRGSRILNVICPLPSFVLRFMFSEEIPELGIEDLVDDFVTFFIAGI